MATQKQTEMTILLVSAGFTKNESERANQTEFRYGGPSFVELNGKVVSIQPDGSARITTTP